MLNILLYFLLVCLGSGIVMLFIFLSDKWITYYHVKKLKIEDIITRLNYLNNKLNKEQDKLDFKTINTILNEIDLYQYYFETKQKQLKLK